MMVYVKSTRYKEIINIQIAPKNPKEVMVWQKVITASVMIRTS